ncbi:DUF5979 domain-containing protein [Arcanobacterium phocae]|uniref:DUF5979 domain-containing protein n=2 Tax=Arcanobacterium phocae TaxID=131112 RepID=UPI001C0ED856|nr:DUF5979 domain-containing protein [Arcanobacterium phocae]
MKITYVEYGYISIGIYKAADPKTQNIITKEKPKVNSFKVAKKVEGLRNINGAEKSFEFSYKCDDKQNGTITVKGDGKPVAADKFFPIGTNCTITETGDVNVVGHMLTKPDPQTITIAKDDVVTATFTNKYVYNEGTFHVKKTVEGDAQAKKLGAAKKFDFSYTCGKETGKLTVPGNGDAVAAGKNFPVGTKCVVEETGNADVEGYTLVKPTKQTLTIGDRQSVEFAFVNEYTKVKPVEGTFQVKKTVAGLADESGKDKQFKFSYTCGDKTGNLTVKGDGKPVVAKEKFPVGTSCTVTENVEAAKVDGYTLKVTEPKQKTVKVAEGKTVEFAFVNTYEKVKPVEGTFQVKKTVAGLADESGKDKQFKFSYTCGDKTGNLTVKGDGKPVVAKEKFPVGTSCTVTENVEAAKVDGYTLKVTEPKQKTVKVAEGKTVEFAFVNTYAPEEAKVTFSKVVAGQGKELAGASLKIVEGEKADGKVVYEWTSEGKAKVFGLKSGVYTMVEDQAPLGFEKAEAITFRVSFDKNGGKVEVKQGDKFVAAKDAKVVMEDKPSLTPEKPKLPKTGLEIGALGIVSLVLIAAGSVIIRRKKTL